MFRAWIVVGSWLAVAAHAGELVVPVDRELPSLLAIYQQLHAAPELSRQEFRTSELLAAQLRSAGFSVTEKVGRYEATGEQAQGVVAILANGEGPTLLIRADMDGLPIKERTGLAYASTVRALSPTGGEVPVMHACGHDLHMAALIGTARLLYELKDHWRGTLVLVGQPAEETIEGARAMVSDGLYTRFPRPDMALALHVTADLPAGTISLTSGDAMAMSTQVDIIVRGVGGHASAPQLARDPILLASSIVVGLQAIVSREMSPLDPAVVTIGTIHGGSKRNIIPDEVKLELNIRTYSTAALTQIINSVRRIARGQAIAAGMPEDRLPEVVVLERDSAPVLHNDAGLTAAVDAAFKRQFGDQAIVAAPPRMSSEDFGHFGLQGQIPALMFRVGAVEPARFEASRISGEPLPSTHSAQFAPAALPTLRTGTIAMVTAALELFRRHCTVEARHSYASSTTPAPCRERS